MKEQFGSASIIDKKRVVFNLKGNKYSLIVDIEYRLKIVFIVWVGTPEYDEVEVLSILIEDYEDKMFPIEHPNPIDAIKFRMEQLGLEQKDMTRYFGYRSRVSEIFSGKRKLNLNMIRKIHRDLGIPARSLIGE